MTWGPLAPPCKGFVTHTLAAVFPACWGSGSQPPQGTSLGSPGDTPHMELVFCVLCSGNCCISWANRDAMEPIKCPHCWHPVARSQETLPSAEQHGWSGALGSAGLAEDSLALALSRLWVSDVSTHYGMSLCDLLAGPVCLGSDQVQGGLPHRQAQA